MTNLAEAIQNACEIARQDERRKFKEYLEKKNADIYWDEPSLIDRNTKLDVLKEIINELFTED